MLEPYSCLDQDICHGNQRRSIFLRSHSPKLRACEILLGWGSEIRWNNQSMHWRHLQLYILQVWKSLSWAGNLSSLSQGSSRCPGQNGAAMGHPDFEHQKIIWYIGYDWLLHCNLSSLEGYLGFRAFRRGQHLGLKLKEKCAHPQEKVGCHQ